MRYNNLSILCKLTLCIIVFVCASISVNLCVSLSMSQYVCVCFNLCVSLWSVSVLVCVSLSICVILCVSQYVCVSVGLAGFSSLDVTVCELWGYVYVHKISLILYVDWSWCYMREAILPPHPSMM